MYQEGKPVFLAAKFLDTAAPSPIKYSHTMLSEKLTETNRQAMLSRHLGMKLNKINVYYANKGDYGSVSTTPWVGTATANDKTRFDLARWRMYDQWVAKLRDSGLVAHMWFFADDSNFGNLSDADRQRLIKYAMARHSAYVNTMFILALEWQEGWTTTEVEQPRQLPAPAEPLGAAGERARHARQLLVPDLVVGRLHGHPGRQFGQSRHGPPEHARPTGRRLPKPVIQEEHGLGQEDTVHRQRAWAAFTGGAGGVGTGSYLQHLVTFTQQVPFQHMDPSDALVTSGSAYALAQAGTAYVFYLYNGGTVGADLRGATGTLIVQWYDPRTGAFRAAPSVTGGAVRSFTAPASGDWVLYIRK